MDTAVTNLFDIPSDVIRFFAQARMPMTLADPELPDCPIILATAAFAAITGYELDEVVGRNCRFLQGAATRDEARVDIRETIRERGSLSITITNYKKDGRRFENVLLIRPITGADGETVRYLLGVQFDGSHFEAGTSYREFLSRENHRVDDLADDRLALMHAHETAAKVAQDRLGRLLQPAVAAAL